MRVLAVRQPWASAIIHGGKDVENRTRNIAGDYRGPIAIHAGLTFDEGAAGEALFDAYDDAIERGDGPAWRKHRGHIIGVVNLWAVHRDRDNGNCCPHRPSGGPGGLPWAERRVWHLCLNDPNALTEPIPFVGSLGLRELPREIEDEVWARRVA